MQKTRIFFYMDHNNKGVQFVVLVGENEMESGVLTVKDMNTGEQNNLNITDLIKQLS